MDQGGNGQLAARSVFAWGWQLEEDLRRRKVYFQCQKCHRLEGPVGTDNDHIDLPKDLI